MSGVPDRTSRQLRSSIRQNGAIVRGSFLFTISIVRKKTHKTKPAEAGLNGLTNKYLRCLLNSHPTPMINTRRRMVEPDGIEPTT
jgi:hypothetical protein